jgi:Flp pilus assembly protein TadD
MREAIRLRPGDARLYNNLGSILLDKNGDMEGGISLFRTALRIAPSYALAHSNLGVAIERTGDIPGALAEYRAAADLDPRNPDYRAYAEHLVAQVKPEEQVKPENKDRP